MGVTFFACDDGEEKRQVGVIGIEQVKPAKIRGVPARHSGEIGVELVVRLYKEIAVRVGEDAGELADKLVRLPFRRRIHNDGQRKVAERLPVAKGAQAIAKIFDICLFRLIYEYISRIR